MEKEVLRVQSYCYADQYKSQLNVTRPALVVMILQDEVGSFGKGQQVS